jgi:hypothetical protein
MKTLFLIFCSFLCPQLIISQTVVSSCSAPDSIKALYIGDADRLALRKIYNQNLTYTSNVIIPQTHADTVLKALIAVYNATTLPARNSVISQYNIHTFPNPGMNHLEVAADSNLTWMQQLKAGNIPTGNAQVDSLISDYDLTLQFYTNYNGWFPYHVVSFASDSNYNLPPLTDLFENVPGVMFSDPGTVIGDGNDISATIYPNYVQLAYSIGWEDCPSGCIYRHYWTFNVYYNCSVEYLGESGTNIPIVSAPSILVSNSYCVNDTLTVTITGANSYSLNNQPITASQFTLSSPTPTSYIILASNNVYPAFATSSLVIAIINCNNPTTSISENKLYSNISLFPNPASDILELKITSEELHKVLKTIEIYNSLGKLIWEEEFSESNLKIKTNDFSTGVYSLIIKTESGEIVNTRFVVAQ